jgi:hypothetical protein
MGTALGSAKTKTTRFNEQFSYRSLPHPDVGVTIEQIAPLRKLVADALENVTEYLHEPVMSTEVFVYPAAEEQLGHSSISEVDLRAEPMSWAQLAARGKAGARRMRSDLLDIDF